ncbi:peptidase C14 [Leifsonia sp. Le1]|uniref:peptidase C14 n=1 Tax=Leifsonia sp. Le1 TaxID=3404918 RepID=UPI003EBDF66C
MNSVQGTTTDAASTAGAPASGTRRGLIVGLGAVVLGGATAIGAATPADAAVVAKSSSSGSIRQARLVRDLAGVKASDGELIAVAGYSVPGDAGDLVYRGASRFDGKPNGGTVIAGKNGTVWLLQHSGTVDFRQFGVFGPDKPADDALDAMVGDPAVSRIEAHTDLNFVRRHTFTRSGLELDFGDHLMTTEGIAANTYDNPFGAVMFFSGTVTKDVQVATLTEAVPDLGDIFPVADASWFAVDSWYAADVNALSGRWEKELQKLVQVTQIVDQTHIRVNYKNGWPLAEGRTITWTRVEPVQNIRISNLVFRGKGTDQYTGSHPIAFEYAVRCDVERVVGSLTFWPLIMRRWNTFYSTIECTLSNPTSVTYGGAGYLTQQIYCLYGYVANCHTSNARHLNDFTASAYSMVENCHGDGDDQGPFVTHGQYEHDLTYTGNSGLMTFANSGAAWGSAAKRITVRKHVCSWFVARVRITDLTLEDVKVIGKPSLAGSGMLWINADGAQLTGCTADSTLVITQSSSASSRPTVIRDSWFRFAAPGNLTDASVKAPVLFDATTLENVGGVKILGAGDVTFRDSRLGAAAGADALQTSSANTRFEGTVLDGVSVLAAGTAAQTVEVVGGSRVSGAGGTGIGRGGSAAVTVLFADSTFARSDNGGAHVSLTGGTNHYRASGCRFDGGKLELSAAGFGSGSTLLHTANVETSVKRVGFPDDSDRVITAGNISV